jgi:hypothetical protein
MLENVLTDQSSIVQALKMVEEEETDSSLRWYVYPKVRATPRVDIRAYVFFSSILT